MLSASAGDHQGNSRYISGTGHSVRAPSPRRRSLFAHRRLSADGAGLPGGAPIQSPTAAPNQGRSRIGIAFPRIGCQRAGAPDGARPGLGGDRPGARPARRIRARHAVDAEMQGASFAARSSGAAGIGSGVASLARPGRVAHAGPLPAMVGSRPRIPMQKDCRSDQFSSLRHDAPRAGARQPLRPGEFG